MTTPDAAVSDLPTEVQQALVYAVTNGYTNTDLTALTTKGAKALAIHGGVS